MRRLERKIPAILVADPEETRHGSGWWWFISTCLAGAVGIGVIAAVMASSHDPGQGWVSAIRKVGKDALHEVKTATRKIAPASRELKPAGAKSDRISDNSVGIATKHIIHDSAIVRVASKEFIKVKPYARVVARMATASNEEMAALPAFNPFKIFANPVPVAKTAGPDTAGAGEPDQDGAGGDVTVRTVSLANHVLPVEDGVEIKNSEAAKLVQLALLSTGDGGPFAGLRPSLANFGEAMDWTASIGPARGGAGLGNNTTVLSKSGDDYAAPAGDGLERKSFNVRRGDTLMGLLARAGIAAGKAKAITGAMAVRFRASALKPGQAMHVALRPAADGGADPERVSLFTGSRHEVTVARNGDGDFALSKTPVTAGKPGAKTRRRAHRGRASLYASLYHSAVKQELPRDMIMSVLRIHSHEVDYKQPVRAGDSFEVFYALEEDESGLPNKPGPVLATSITLKGDTRRYYRYRTPDDKRIAYYDETGDSAKKFLMRRPINGARQTSGFGMRRHPILRYAKMHTGTDFAAPRGTPIMAAGRGVIEKAGRRGGYGNHVRIRHANGYMTTYSHMRRIAKGVRTGVKVQQGQIIGYLGSTGLSTGPHLHYEVLVNSKFVNPMGIRLPRGRKLKGRLLAGFHKERLRIDRLMNRAPVTTQVAAMSN